MTTYKLTLGQQVLFESETATELAAHTVEKFPPNGDFPPFNMHNAGFAIASQTVTDFKACGPVVGYEIRSDGIRKRLTPDRCRCRRQP